MRAKRIYDEINELKRGETATRTLDVGRHRMYQGYAYLRSIEPQIDKFLDTLDKLTGASNFAVPIAVIDKLSVLVDEDLMERGLWFPDNLIFVEEPRIYALEKEVNSRNDGIKREFKWQVQRRTVRADATYHPDLAVVHIKIRSSSDHSVVVREGMIVIAPHDVKNK